MKNISLVLAGFEKGRGAQAKEWLLLEAGKGKTKQNKLTAKKKRKKKTDPPQDLQKEF